MRKSTLALAAFAALSAAAPAEAATTLINENFTSGLGVFTATGQVGINNGNGYIGCCQTTGTAANMSNNFVAFGSNNLASGTITSPTFDLLAGETYTLTFDAGALGQLGLSEMLTVTLGPAFVSFQLFTNDNLDTTFGPYTVILTVPNTQTATLSFTSSGGTNIDSIIDNVALFTTADLPVLSGVPEPASWAMMLLGFGAIGFAVRRRKVAALA